MIFLRPWFLILIAVPFIFKMFQKRLSSASEWYKVIDEKLLPYLLIKGTNATARQRRVFRIVLWVLLSVAMAGPAWYKMEVPVRTSKPATVIILEISPALQGNLLQKAHQKIYDALALLKGEQVALVLYDRFGYTAGPLTFETDIIKNMVPYLNSDILPSQESNPSAGFEQADRLLRNAGIKQGRILFLTSGAFLPEKLFRQVADLPHKVAVLGIGSAEPHPIPLPQGGFLTNSDGKPVMVTLNAERLGKLGTYRQMTPTDDDLALLIDDTIPEEPDMGRELAQNLSLWQDMGVWFVVLALPFFALLFRRQVAVIFLILCLTATAQAGWWQRPDQEDYQRRMSGVRHYWEKKYDKAEELFQKGGTADDFYNLGNTLAFQEKIDEAIEAYTQALAQDPTHEDALFNKEYLEKLKEPPEEEKEQPEDQQDEQDQQDEEQPEDQQDEQDQQDEEQPEDQQDEQEQQDEEQPEDQQDEQDQQDEERPEDQQDEQEQQDEEQPEDQQEEQQNQQDIDQAEDQKEEEQPEDMQSKEDQTDDGEQPNDIIKGEEEETTPQDAEPEPPPPVGQEPDQQEPEESVFDQESEQILNKLPSNVNNVLRYRIHQQYRRYMGK